MLNVLIGRMAKGAGLRENIAILLLFNIFSGLQTVDRRPQPFLQIIHYSLFTKKTALAVFRIRDVKGAKRYELEQAPQFI
jgi:hypothetical protein